MLGEWADQVLDQASRSVPVRQHIFRIGWALVALFHLAGNPRPSFAPGSVVFAVASVALGLAAVTVLLRPRSQWPLWSLCVLVPVTAWLEAPIVGNHWVLASAISLAYLMASLVAAVRARPMDPESVWPVFAPTARLILLIAYGFAAFAKLNSGFFDPVTSCAVYYHDQLVSSWGLDALSVAGHPTLGRMTAIGAAAVELSVPLLLLFRRRIGVLLALSFHWMLAMDLAQHFWDFSSVLFVAFLLFLDDRQLADLARRARDSWRRLRASFRLTLITLGIVMAAVPVAAAALSGNRVVLVLAHIAGHLSWWVLGTGLLALVALTTFKTRSDGQRVDIKPRGVALWLIPAVVAFNGLTPYLELKTGFGWNMYSNLRSVAGDTNHLLVPHTLDLTGLQKDQVEIVDSSDETLMKVARADYRIAYSEFREYAHDYPETSVVYRRGGRLYSDERVGDGEAGSGQVSVISRRLQSFRLIDASGGERCQPVFSAAR